jgi:outer membrane protein assembly factor BamB
VIGEDGTIYVASAKSGVVHAVTPTGSKQWSWTVPGASATAHGTPRGLVSTPDGKLIVTAEDPGAVYELDTNGQLLWSFDAKLGTKDPYMVTPAIVTADGSVIFSTDFGYEQTNLIGLGPDGKPKFTTPAPGLDYPLFALGPDGTIYASGDALHAFGPNGQLKWQVSLNGGVGAPSVDAEGKIYVSSSQDYVGAKNGFYVVSASGQILASSQMVQRNWTPASIGADGTVYVPGRDGALYAIKP